MSDDDIDDFHINDEGCRAKLFDAMKTDFETYGPMSKKRVLEAIEFILSSRDLERYWRAVVPHALPLDEIVDKPGYLRALYQKLAEHEPPQKEYGADVQLISDLHNIDFRL
ncbi:hypothetical protein J2W23_004704 [Variovorax boronicumulans]|uniref:hypothetical protein n=1 Tax=Variovorax boronicumulans TaxID=436515 RepID=UPI002783990B|nr:hypothetical protein [Variovorax boronicumulans]MDQ0016302.1 hypothetical protein [Variovorax boronicumulans]